jgi:uncharacterized membrane protein SpoIIM required for sporulation
MLESLINPKKAERKPWEMFFIGLIYASLSLLLVHWFFSSDAILSQYSGVMVVTFCVMFSLPFMYFIIRREENNDEVEEGRSVWKIHKDAIYALMWLFLGFIIAFSFWYIILQDNSLFNAQVGTYCLINSPNNVNGCITQYLPGASQINGAASAASPVQFVSIFENNLLVMIFTLLFSLVFGAGAIFVLAWNASVISASIGIFTKYNLVDIPLGLARYMIHGFPEISAYFIAALAGGIFGVGIARHGIKNPMFAKVAQHTAILILISIGLLAIAGLMEVYLTPLLFH